MSEGFGYGGYRGAAPPPPPPPPASLHSIPLPPIYGPLRSVMSAPPPGYPMDQQPARQTVRTQGSHVRVAVAAGPGCESVVPFSLFNQMMLRMERLERENSDLLNIVLQLNSVIEKERKTTTRVYEHPTLATSTAPPVESTASEPQDTLPDEASLPEAPIPAIPQDSVPEPPWRVNK